MPCSFELTPYSFELNPSTHAAPNIIMTNNIAQYSDYSHLLSSQCDSDNKYIDGNKAMEKIYGGDGGGDSEFLPLSLAGRSRTKYKRPQII